MDETPSVEPMLNSCVVWTSIPLLSWLFPCLGHAGICDSKGIVYDFEGSGYIGKGKLLFGDPMQYWRLDVDSELLDNSIKEVSKEFKNQKFNLFCSNCHFYVASILEKLNYPLPNFCCSNWRNGATIKLAWSLVLHAKSISGCKFLNIWIPFLIFWAIILFFYFFKF